MGNNKKIRLQGHEKFSLRDGWLNKGLIMVNRDPFVFQGKNGPDIFGIGNNMVKSLRYWLRAFKLMEDSPTKGAKLTDFGRIILENDPYLEDIYTIWLLHSHIAKNAEEATSWFVFFNKVDFEEMEKEYIEAILLREITKYASGIAFSDKSVKNDLDVLLNMYSKSKTISDPEDKSMSPFAQLNLVKNGDGKYSKVHPDRKHIDEWVVLFEMSVMLEEKEYISIEDAVDGENGLAKIYQLTSVSSNELLDRLEALDYIRINRTAGLDVIYKNKEMNPKDAMEEYYKHKR